MVSKIWLSLCCEISPVATIGSRPPTSRYTNPFFLPSFLTFYPPTLSFSLPSLLPSHPPTLLLPLTTPPPHPPKMKSFSLPSTTTPTRTARAPPLTLNFSINFPIIINS